MIVVWLTLAAFVAGLVDAIAGGGGIVTVPALLATGLPPHVVLATNKAQAVWGSGTALATFARRGLVTRSRAPVSFATALVGSFAGARLVLWMEPSRLRAVVVAMLLVAAVLSFVKKPDGAEGTAFAKARPHLVGALVGFPIGVYDGFFGPGTGTFFLLAYAYLYGDDLLLASGNAKVGNFASNLAAFALFAASGAVRWDLAVPMGAAQLVGSFLGVRLASRVGAKGVRWVATGICVLLAGRAVWQMAR